MIKKEEIQKIREVAHTLREAPRSGSPADEPEGSRFIRVSDTLMNEIAVLFDMIADIGEKL